MVIEPTSIVAYYILANVLSIRSQPHYSATHENNVFIITQSVGSAARLIAALFDGAKHFECVTDQAALKYL